MLLAYIDVNFFKVFIKGIFNNKKEYLSRFWHFVSGLETCPGPIYDSRNSESSLKYPEPLYNLIVLYI